MKLLKPIKSLLSFLRPCQENLKLLDIGPTFSGNEIQEEYAAWLRLLNALKHPLERHFFKSTWVPINKESLEHFIDLEDDNLSIFCTHYHCIEPYQWYRIYITDNTTELIDHIKDIEKLKLIHKRYKMREEQKCSELTLIY